MVNISLFSKLKTSAPQNRPVKFEIILRVLRASAVNPRRSAPMMQARMPAPQSSHVIPHPSEAAPLRAETCLHPTNSDFSVTSEAKTSRSAHQKIFVASGLGRKIKTLRYPASPAVNPRRAAPKLSSLLSEPTISPHGVPTFLHAQILFKKIFVSWCRLSRNPFLTIHVRDCG